ncbi:hypothetical protein Pla108_20150 [Botrimarina colliarenosi]|uniref:Uncharacterized protein n=1 Tax=Botrimarina colliarenosi TaxID=2528001 RepID=A0A5C6AFL7_9BACT|nr:hypothetical protein [Botrimarina colliarenosi]TWT97861.1 hypothetical protein Pla108_20150 [Botrimarina colliarenosi]
MLLPRFTLRTGLLGLTVGSVVAIVIREAVLGAPWAIGVTVALGSVALSFTLQAIAFALSLALSRSGGREPRR